MTIPSNLYAEKVFSEHPLALWPLDETVDYISLISEANRNLSSAWSDSPYKTVSKTISSPSSAEKLGLPFPSSSCLKLTSNEDGTSLIENISLRTNSGIALSSLDPDLFTFSVSTYVKALQSYTARIELGYILSESVFNPSNYQLGQKRVFTAIPQSEWSMFAATFNIPETTYQYIYPFITISYVNQLVAQSPTQPDEYSYVVNGIAIGQYIEQFSATSLGIESQVALATEEAELFGATKYITGNQYGLGSNDAKYLISGNTLLASNVSIPMVYGAKNLTKMRPNPTLGKPSMVFPGMGMLFGSGRYNQYTFETWIRIDARNTEPRRILGPVSSTYGLYVDGPFLRLNIGDAVGTYFIGEWYRPMLIDLRLALNSASLLVNGEEVISISFDTDSLLLPTDASSNYWGFFAYEDVPIVEIDSPAIYSYVVPSITAKRKFGYGQAVESPDGANKSFGATTAFIDYSVADYTNNYQYPDIGKWNQGISENINTDGRTLSSPTVFLPDFVFSSSDYDTWLTEQKLNADEFFTFASKPGFVRFNDIAINNEQTKGLYTVFSVSSFSSSEQTIFKLVNKISSDEFKVTLLNDILTYSLTIRGVEQIVDQKQGVTLNTKTFVGISFDALSEFYGGDVLSFFGSSAQLMLFVAGDNSFTTNFTGKIYKVGLCTARNLKKVESFFEVEQQYGDVDAGESGTLVWFAVLDGGYPDSFDVDGIYDHIATYTLRASIDYGVYDIDVDCDSYWQDYIPLSYFAQYVKDIFDNEYYDLDMLQFNIDYPSIPRFGLNNYDTSNALVRSYVSFQLVQTGATKQLSSFAEVASAPQNGVISSSSSRYTSGWMDTAFEVVDGMVLYPPKDIDLRSYAVVTHIEMKVIGAIKNKINIRNLQYASQAFNDNTANPIGTKYNVNIYPYQKFSLLFDYKGNNPYRIYKGSTPYLYLTRKTGIEKVGDYDPLINRGFLVNINSKQAENYQIIASQMFLYYGKDLFPSGEVKLFEIESTYGYIKVYMVPVDKSRKRVRLYAVNAKTGSLQDGIAFYINGQLVHTPTININEWTVLGVRFSDPIKFDNNVGAIRVTGPMLVNNISYYESSSLQEVERQSLRHWDAIAQDSNTWGYWKDKLTKYGETYLWRDVLVVSSTKFYGIGPDNIYKAYTGTNKIIAGDDATLFLGGIIDYKVTKGLEWSSNIVKPL